MRSKEEMLGLIVDVAEKDDRIRAVGLNGSRTNPEVKEDVFQDYDVVYVVESLDPFIGDSEWIHSFGETIIVQTPDLMELYSTETNQDSFAYLMLFADGNRIDLTLIPLSNSHFWNRGDSLAVILLDKDDSLPNLPEPTDTSYWTKKPTESFYQDCCNEFWWVSTYVAKGLWRSEAIYAYDHLTIVRSTLLQMIEWKVAHAFQYKINVGKNYKYLNQYITENEWNRLVSLYPPLNEAEMWKALFTATSWFEQLSVEVAEQLAIANYSEQGNKVLAYLEQVYALPRDR